MLILNFNLGEPDDEDGGGCTICRAKEILRDYAQTVEAKGLEPIDEDKLETLVNDFLVLAVDEHEDIAVLRKALKEADLTRWGHVAVMLRLKLLSEVAAAAASGLAQLGLQDALADFGEHLEKKVEDLAETTGVSNADPDDVPDWLLEILTSPEHQGDE